MRCDLAAGLLALALALLGGCTPALCGRNSDCTTGQVCTARGTCGAAPDAAAEGQPTDGGSTGGAGQDAEENPFADADRRSRNHDGSSPGP